MNQLSQVKENAGSQPCNEECRKRWVESVEQLADNKALKSRIEFLERQIATNAFGGWQLH